MKNLTSQKISLYLEIYLSSGSYAETGIGGGGGGGVLVPNRWTIMEQEIYILLKLIHNMNFIKQS